MEKLANVVATETAFRISKIILGKIDKTSNNFLSLSWEMKNFLRNIALRKYIHLQKFVLQDRLWQKYGALCLDYHHYHHHHHH